MGCSLVFGAGVPVICVLLLYAITERRLSDLVLDDPEVKSHFRRRSSSSISTSYRSTRK
jgi:hypothetical protein